MVTNYKLASNTWDSLEAEAILEVLNSGNYTMGKRVSEFEDEFSDFLNVKHSIMVNSGSSANLIALASIKYSNEFTNEPTVIVPAVSWSTTFFPLHQMGFKLRFVDIDLDTLNLNLQAVENAIDESVVAIMAVSLLGNPEGLSELSRLCDNRGLLLIEDNCESFGAKNYSKFAGTYGKVSTHSFFFSHHLQTMEGGMVCTNDDTIAIAARSLRAHGWTRDQKSGKHSDAVEGGFNKSFEFVLPGYCVRPIEFMGAVGSVQLKKWPTMLDWRIKNANIFKNIITDYSNIIKIQQTPNSMSSWFGFSMILHGKASGKRADLEAVFKKYGIEYRPIVAGNFTRQTVIKHLNVDSIGVYKNADQVHLNGIFIGNDSRCLAKELSLLSSSLQDFMNQYVN